MMTSTSETRRFVWAFCEIPTDKKMSLTQNGASYVCELKPNRTAAMDTVFTKTSVSFTYSDFNLEPSPFLY